MDRATEITPLQARFAASLVECGGNASAAARAAGYSETSARVIAHRLMRNPSVQAEIRARQWERVNGPLTSASLNVIRQALDMSNDSVPWGVRLEAAKTILDRSGLTLAEHPDRKPDDDPARADLSALLGRLVQARDLQARKATAIDPAP